MSFDSASPRPRGPLAWAIKTTLILGLGATALAHHITKPSGRPGDPEVTGSIDGGRSLGGARTTRLDPCTLRGAADAPGR